MSDPSTIDATLWTLVYLDTLRAYSVAKASGEIASFAKQIADKSLALIKAQGSADVAIDHLSPRALMLDSAAEPKR